MDVAELFKSLESNHPQIVEDIKKKFHEYLNATKESWLLNGLMDYYLATGSLRVVDILIGIREPQEKYLFDRLSETLRGSSKLQGLTLLGHIVRRHPTWLYKITNHSLLKDLLKLLKAETDMLPVMSALLVIIVLLPMIAGLVAPYLQEIFEVFSRLASWNTNNPNKVPEGHLLHLQIGLYALFHRLYGMFPCNFLSYLRHEYSQRDNLIIFKHTIRPMLDTIKMHPFLVISAKDAETTSQRWKKMEPHDIIVECARFAVDASERTRDEVPKEQPRVLVDRPSRTVENRSALESSGVLDGSYTSRGVRAYSSQLPSTNEKDLWTPKTVCGAMSPPESSAPTSIPHTPISQTFSVGSLPQPEGTSPPEAAVEATPETTPVKDIRHIGGRGPPPIGSSVVRALNPSLGASAGGGSPLHSQPSSPMKKEPSPYRFPPDPSAFQQMTASAAMGRGVSELQQRRDSAVIVQKMQRIMIERNQVSEQEAKLKLKTSGGGTQPTSPLRVITPTSVWSGIYDTPGSPLLLASEDTQEDREVESTLRAGEDLAGVVSGSTAGASGSLSGGRHCDSVLQDVLQHHTDDHDEYEDCPQESGSPCTSGGLHMPTSQSMKEFAQQVSRLRYYSHSAGTTEQMCGGGMGSMFSGGGSDIPASEGGFLSDTKVRRAVSCPEMKKSTSTSQLPLPIADRPLDESEEDDSRPTVNGHSPAQEIAAAAAASSCKRCRRRMISASAQTDSPLPYEHLFLGVFPPLEQQQHHTPPPPPSEPTAAAAPPSFPSNSKASRWFSPYEAIETYIAITTDLHNERRSGQTVEAELKQCKEQLVLMNLLLQFERHRREVHAERNRRLLGKSRANRSLEEHNSALQDQVMLLQNDTDRIGSELELFRKEATWKLQNLQESDGYWRDQTKDVQKAYEEVKACCDTLQQELRQEREKTATVTKTLNETKSTLIDSNQERQLALNMLSSSREARNELQTVQRELLIQGETQQRVRESLTNFAKSANRASELALRHDAYSYQVEVLSKQLEVRKSAYYSLSAKVAELETLVAEKDALLAEQKCLLANAQSEHTKQYSSLESRYSELSRVHIRLEEQVVDYQAQIEILANKVKQLQQQSSGSGTGVRSGGSAGEMTPLSLASVPSSGLPVQATVSRSRNTLDLPVRNLQLLIEDTDLEAASATSPLSDNAQ